MMECSGAAKTSSGVHGIESGPCAGGVQKNGGVFRRLRSTRDGRVRINQKQTLEKPPFDPTAWFAVEVKRNSELKCRDFLNQSDLGFGVEAYVAAQVFFRKNTRRLQHQGATSDDKTDNRQEKVVIHGKVFIRVNEGHRVEVLKLCPLIKRYVTDPSLTARQGNLTSFARIPDLQIQRVRHILDMADGLAEYTETIPEVNDSIQVVGGQLLKGELFKDIRGQVVMVNGRKNVTVILDGVGCFKCRLPLEDIVKAIK